jgi:hypothetical protein
VNPGLLALFLVAGLVGLIPVWRLRAAGWSAGALATCWILYTLGIFVAVRFPGPFRLVLPILVVAYVAPFIAGPERLSRVLGKRTPAVPPVKNVTPPLPPALPDGDEEHAQDDHGPQTTGQQGPKR